MKKKVLLLGAGLVSRPLVQYLLDNDFYMIIATRTVSKADALLAGHPNGRTLPLDLTDPAGLDALIEESDLVISLVPYTFHVQIARRCLELVKPLVTTSYVSNEMRELTEEAKAKGLLFLNEIGLDPGIDHMSAMRIIHEVQNKGGKIVSFRSCCGGLPAPEVNDNPWGYKFSWSPRGVLLAGRNPAQFREGGKVRDIASEDLFGTVWPMTVGELPALENYPNRDSLGYDGIYGLHEAKTMFRGTIRYAGWCAKMKALTDLGWTRLDPPPSDATSLGQMTQFLCGKGTESMTEQQRVEMVCDRLGLDPAGDVIARIKWAGLLSDEPVPAAAGTILDVLGDVLQVKLAYAEGERDMIVLVHEFVSQTAEGKEQRITSTLVDFGVPGGDSAMSRTVSLPAAIATRLILEGKIDASGVRVPVDPKIYNPVLDELENLGIECKEVWHD